MTQLIDHEMVSLSAARPTHMAMNVLGGPFETGFRSDGTKHSTIANNGRTVFL